MIDIESLRTRLPDVMIHVVLVAQIITHVCKAVFSLLALVVVILHATGWAPYGWALDIMLDALVVSVLIVVLMIPVYVYSRRRS